MVVRDEMVSAFSSSLSDEDIVSKRDPFHLLVPPFEEEESRPLLEPSLPGAPAPAFEIVYWGCRFISNFWSGGRMAIGAVTDSYSGRPWGSSIRTTTSHEGFTR
uniref:Uncharacterized protein n=1 Tax=Cacopsylla melanoneura TaxID=428564 RepID=A0A8D8Z7X6_9HEMI